VYASLFVPARIAISGDPKRFLERVAKIQAGLLICVYCLSHAPAILSLVLTTRPTEPNVPVEYWEGSNASVLFFFVLIVQLNDVFQYMWSQLLGKHVIAPQINASRTWEGLIGGTLSTMLTGMLLWWATPFGPYWAGPIAGAVALAGFAGSMTMSGIKRDRGVEDYGTLVSGHAGVLDRIDSLCFAAPVFFHITRFFFSTMQ
jgi:phosphatidate cytidylyltransferase